VMYSARKRTCPAFPVRKTGSTMEYTTMFQEKPCAMRFVGLDIHKHYLVAYAVDRDANRISGPQRVPLSDLEAWRQKRLTAEDAVVLEMTTNALQLYDDLLPHVHSVTVVHPPHVALITRNRVMNDKIAARILASLHAKGLLVSIWIPPQPIRELRALLAQRTKMVRLSTQAKNRLHAVLHRHHLPLPEEVPFKETMRTWWLALPVDPLERMRIQTDFDTLIFAQRQIAALEECLAALSAKDRRVPFLMQTPGIGMLTALTLLAGIGDIDRFPTARQLVGYAGLGASVHDSGKSHREGRITKAGRRDMRTALVEAAQTASHSDGHWRSELQRLEPRLGYNKAIVAIARKLLVVAWHTLSKETVDRHADAEQVARKFMGHADRIGRRNRASGQTAAAYVREQLDHLGLGRELTAIQRGQTRIALPPSSLDEAAQS
jgi:transposase